MEYRTNEEMYIPAEYASRAKEYHTPAKETFVGTTKEKEKSGKTSLFQKTRKMGYLVVAAVATVTIAQAAAWETPETQETPSTVQQIDISAFDNWGSANGGVIPVKLGSRWGLMNLQGEMVCEAKYDNLCGTPNKEGYSVFYSMTDKSYYVLNNRGEEVFALEEQEWHSNAREDAVLVTDDNIIYFSYGNSYVGYWTIDGELIYEATAGDDVESIYSTPFHDGVAMLSRNYSDNSQELYKLSADGTLTEVPGWESKRQNYEWRGDNYADGYVLCYDRVNIWQNALYNVETGAVTSIMDYIKVTDDYLSEYQESYITEEGESYNRVLSVYCMNNALVVGYGENNMGWTEQEVRGTQNIGLYLRHYGTYACLSDSYQSFDFLNLGSVLFDYNDVNSATGSLDRVIAKYDYIQLNDFPYLFAKDGDDYFYIDYSGAVVSDTYAYAISFNDEGYAMVMDADGNAYLINDSFEKLDTISGCTEIENCGQAFACRINDLETLYVPAGY